MNPSWRAALALWLVPATGLALGPYQVGPGASVPGAATSDLLGYSAAARADAGNGYAAFGALVGRYVAVYRLVDGPQRLQFQQRLSSPSSADDFGAALALDHAADRPLQVVVGANVDDQLGFNTGRVYVYRQVGSSLTLVQQLVSPMPVSTGNFGTSLSLHGEWLAVGEPKARTAGIERGAVHLFRWQGTAYGLHTSLPGTDPEGRFGQSVALQGEDLVIGAVLEDDTDASIAQTGAVHLYRLTDGAWTFVQRVLADDRKGNDRLGVSVALDGDTVLAGAANDDKPAGGDAGSVYVYQREAGTWSQRAKLRSSEPQTQERFGQSVALAGNEALIGAYCLVGGCVGIGAVEVHVRTGSVWTVVQRIQPTAPAGAQFGHSLALAGRDRVVVGAFNTDGGGGPASGAAFLLTGADQVFYSGME